MTRAAEHRHRLLDWKPDQQMIAAVLAVPKSHVPLTQMSHMDRCWLVAGLTLAGLTAEDIAERTGCSERLAKGIRAEPATIMAAVARDENVELDRELSKERSQHAATRGERELARREACRLRTQLDQIIDQLQTSGKVETFLCGCPRVESNVYRHAGKQYCRRCRAKRQARRRAAKKVQQQNAAAKSAN